MSMLVELAEPRIRELFAGFAKLRIGILGDFCLDRYLEIDPTIDEISIETGLHVHNVVRVRSQPGAAGTVLNNLVALGTGSLLPIGWCGEDGEGFELQSAMRSLAGVSLDHFFATNQRRTFTYCKPLLMHAGRPPEELSRLDSKNREQTPAAIEERLCASLQAAASQLDALVVMDQVPLVNTGAVTSRVLEAIGELAKAHPQLTIIADSRRSLAGWPSGLIFKMNAHELAQMNGSTAASDLPQIAEQAVAVAKQTARPVFITLSERGILAATPSGETYHYEALPLRGAIDIVGAGDSVTASLVTCLASGASLKEALTLSMLNASVVVHKLGTTGTSSLEEALGLSRA